MKFFELIDKKDAIFIDIEGVLVDNLEKGNAFPDALEFMNYLKDKKFQILTNLARISSIRVSNILTSVGFTNITPDVIINPTKAALNQILAKRFSKPVKVFLISEGGHVEDISIFSWIEIVKNEPIDAILLGANRSLTYAELNFAFQLFMKGKPLIVLGGDLYSYGKCFNSEGYFLMEGAFAKVLEMATNKEAIYVGKPSKEMYLEALERVNLDPSRVLMIGDSYKTDILGAVRLGIDSLLIDRKGCERDVCIESIENEAREGTKIFISQSLALDKEIERIF